MSEEHGDTPTGPWQLVQNVPPLEEGTVHVWLLRLASSAPAARRSARAAAPVAPAGSHADARRLPHPSFSGARPDAALSEEEAARARQLLEPARSRFVFTRHALRTRLAGYLGCAPAAIDFAYGETGKPRLRSQADVHFSVAHSGDHALLAFARGVLVGVDLERVRPIARRARVAARVLAPASAAALARVPRGERDEAFIWAWTQREAYVKAIGGGVLRSPDPLPFLWPPRQCEYEGWSIAPLPVGSGHQGCLLVHGSGQRVRLFRPG